MREDPLLLPRDITNGEKYDPAMKIETQQGADDYFVLLVEHCLRCYPAFQDSPFVPHPRTTAEMIERSNLGYWAGYFDHATRERVERLFKCEHPVFGSIAKNGPPTFEQAFQAGVKMGERKK